MLILVLVSTAAVYMELDEKPKKKSKNRQSSEEMTKAKILQLHSESARLVRSKCFVLVFTVALCSLHDGRHCNIVCGVFLLLLFAGTPLRMPEQKTVPFTPMEELRK